MTSTKIPTARKPTEQALRESEFFFRASQRAASIGSYKTDFVTGVWQSSEVLDQIFGIDERFVRDVPGWLSLVYPEDREMMSRYLTGLITERREHFHREYRIVRPCDGQARWVLGLGNMEFSPSGEPLSLIGTIQDISERREAELALVEREERLRLAVVSSPFPIMIHAEDGAVLQVSDSWCAITGYTRDELATVGRWSELAYDEQQLTRETIDSVAALDAPMREGRLAIRIKDGTRRIWDFSTAPLGRATDGRRLVIRVAMDVTEREQAEAERQKLEEQLLVSQKMEAVGLLAGGVAHDFNNLLSVILSFTEFALEELAESDPVREDLLEVQHAGQRGAALTRQLLAFSRKQVLQPMTLDLNATVAGVEKMLRRILGEDIELAQVLAPDLWQVHADPGQIEQVLMNLVVNSRDAMPQGGQLVIETSNVEIDQEYAARHLGVSAGPHVQLVVRDTGHGIDPEHLARLFEPFFTTKEQGKGTGLGLSTVYGIVQQSGGHVSVQSELGRGTTFTIRLPRQVASAPAAARTSRASARPTGSETILVVEDEAAIREVVRRSLQAAGYVVLTAAGGAAALALAAAHQGEIDLLLTDVVMPQMGGGVLAREMVNARPRIKVLYMSGYTNDAILHHGEMQAGTPFLAKPFSGRDLTRKVREVLDQA